MEPDVGKYVTELGPTLAAALIFFYVFWKSAKSNPEPISPEMKLWIIQNLKDPLILEIRKLRGDE